MSDYNEKAILITGCSSGIGRSCAFYLAERGYLIFAGVRKQEDAEQLAASGIKNLVPVYPLDLTKSEDMMALGRTEKSFRKMDANRSDPELVARIVFRALKAKKPKRRYRAGHLSGVSAIMECLPHPVVDMIMEKR